jgi:phenylalanyl-tRNA synthetase beta chain
LGSGGKVNLSVLRKYDINQDIYCFEFDLTKIKSVQLEVKQYKEPLKYPKVIRDFAFIFDKSVQYLDIKNYILKKSSNLLKDVRIFDIFESEALGTNKKSMAFTLEFYDETRTLTEDEVEKDFKSLIKNISKEFDAQLRGN